MLTKTCLTIQDLQELLAGVWEYNQRGPVVAVRCFSEYGNTCDIRWIEVVTEESGLRVRSRPELSSGQIVASIGVGVLDGNR